MSPADFALLQPNLQRIPAPINLVLSEPNVPIQDVYFPELGFASITTDTSQGKVEVGMIGREGLVGATPLILDSDRSPHTVFIQMPGELLRLSTAHLLEAVDNSRSLRNLLLRSIQVLLVQTAQTAFVNAAYTIEVRLARWLLMCRDRGESNTLLVTHEFLSMMLGVRRPGVTVALQVLEGNRLIKAQRGQIRLLDRAGLEAVADDSYGVAEAEHRRLIGGSEVADIVADTGGELH